MLWLNKTSTILKSIILFLVISAFAQDNKSLTRADLDFALIYCFDGLEESAAGHYAVGNKKFRLSLEYNPYSLETVFYLRLSEADESVDTSQKLFRVLLAMKKGRLDSADSLMTGLSGDIYIDVLKGYLAIQRGAFEKGLILLTSSASEDNNAAYIYYLKGMALKTLRRNKEAVNNLTSALKLQPLAFDALYQRGLVYRDMQLFDLAINDFERVLLLAPPLSRQLEEGLVICQTYNQRGVELLRQNNYLDAIADFSRAIEIHPHFSEPYLNRGNAYRSLNNFSQAIHDFNTAIDLNEKYTDAFFNRAITFLDMAQTDQALIDLKTVILFNPNYAKAYFQLGEIAFNTEDYYLAISWYDSTIYCKPDYYWVFYKRAQAFDRLRKFPGAVQDYDIFYAMAPDSFYAQKLNAWERSRLLKKWLDEQKNR